MVEYGFDIWNQICLHVGMELMGDGPNNDFNRNLFQPSSGLNLSLWTIGYWIRNPNPKPALIEKNWTSQKLLESVSIVEMFLHRLTYGNMSKLTLQLTYRLTITSDNILFYHSSK